MITYQEDTFNGNIKQLSELAYDHYKEIARNQDQINLNPDWDRYLQLEKLGIMHIVTARNNKKIIGYTVNLISNNIHYKDHLYAMNDVLFLDKKYRGKMVGVRLIKYSEECLKKRGVKIILMHVKLAHDFGPMLSRIGYTAIEHVYEKVIS